MPGPLQGRCGHRPLFRTEFGASYTTGGPGRTVTVPAIENEPEKR
jgi:hypothetical protein